MRFASARRCFVFCLSLPAPFLDMRFWCLVISENDLDCVVVGMGIVDDEFAGETSLVKNINTKTICLPALVRSADHGFGTKLALHLETAAANWIRGMIPEVWHILLVTVA